MDRIQGSRAENLEAAIKAFEAALTVRTREAFPQDWAMTQNNLGNAYQDRIQGSRAENLEAAIKAFEAALTVRTREASPRDRLQTAKIWRRRGSASTIGPRRCPCLRTQGRPSSSCSAKGSMRRKRAT